MSNFKVIIEGSGKHCHLTRETVDALFGAGFELEQKKMLSQPGQYATPHKVTVVGPKRTTEVSILGPFRPADQIELSLSDARAIGLEPPIRESGDVKGSPGCKLVGPKVEVTIDEGVIIAKRHVHMIPEDAVKFGVSDKQIIKVKVEGERALIFDEVVARVNKDFATFMHVDYDEMNAAGISGKDPTGTIIV